MAVYSELLKDVYFQLLYYNCAKEKIIVFQRTTFGQTLLCEISFRVPFISINLYHVNTTRSNKKI